MIEYSPNLSIATAGVEIAAAVWALRSPGRPAILRTTALILVLLAGYQLVEVFVCAQPGELLWARAAFADVIWLPALGAHLVVQLAQPRREIWARLARGGLLVAGAFSVWVFVDPDFVSRSVCQAVVASFTFPSSTYELYGGAYHLGLWAMMFGGVAAMVHVERAVDRAHLGDVVMGTIGFVVPSLLTVLMVPAAAQAMPSVMCHYALVLGLLLTRLIARERREVGARIASPSASRWQADG
jgi:hypothetical protein